MSRGPVSGTPEFSTDEPSNEQGDCPEPPHVGSVGKATVVLKT